MDAVFLYNEDLENKVAKIKRLLHLSMNGVVSESMSSLGYKLNYGVQLPRIKELAGELEADFPLAQRLWFSDCREMMILATLLCPIGSLTETEVLKWVERCHNMEMVEQLSINLLSKWNGANTLCVNLLADENEYAKALAYVLSSILSRRGVLSEETLGACRKAMTVDVYSSSHAVYSSVARLVRVWAEEGERAFVESFLQGVETASGYGAAWVKDNVSTVLMY